jgi:diketogulonate reductase-like aldo/keto reductase
MTEVPTVRLNTGNGMPQLGFGVFQVPPPEAAEVVRTALEAGYRSIDTAAMYGNEEGVGQALADSGIERSELFITTKLNNPEHRAGVAEQAFTESLRRLRLDYVDLYLIHWPLPSADRYLETWQVLEKIFEDGRARAIGVSNFQQHHLQRLLDEATVVPAVNQVELHPYLVQEPLRAFHTRHGIATEAWSPLGKGRELLREPTVVGIAEKYGVTPAQTVIRWHLQMGNVVIPKSANRERIRSNFDVFGFELADDDMDEIGTLNRGRRLGPDPDTIG